MGNDKINDWRPTACRQRKWLRSGMRNKPTKKKTTIRHDSNTDDIRTHGNGRSFEVRVCHFWTRSHTNTPGINNELHMFPEQQRSRGRFCNVPASRRLHEKPRDLNNGTHSLHRRTAPNALVHDFATGLERKQSRRLAPASGNHKGSASCSLASTQSEQEVRGPFRKKLRLISGFPQPLARVTIRKRKSDQQAPI
ncbi:hypothetical protein Q8A73_004202 [Channa argus]|nr:hypothetical protein Q8A73_004202 [Channa argus]